MNQQSNISAAILALRLVWALLLASSAQALPGPAGRAYPPNAMVEGACFTSTCTLSGGSVVGGTTYGSGSYSATFSSLDGRWQYSPRFIFDKSNNTGYSGRWLEGTYLCPADTPSECNTRLSNNPAGDSYHGEWVKLNVPVGNSVGSVVVTAGGTGYSGSSTVSFSAPGGTGVTATGSINEASGVVTSVSITDAGSGYTAAPSVTFSAGGATANAYLSGITVKRISIWAVNANQRPLRYKLYGSVSANGPWVVVINSAIADIIYDANGLHTANTASTPISYPYYMLVVGKCSGGTLEINELVLEDTTDACPVATYLHTAQCLLCTQGTYTPGISATLNTHCSLSCQAGTYMATQGTTVCTSCTAGTYVATTGAAACLPCDDGKFSATGATACTSCPPGSQHNALKTSCVTCAAGTESAGGAACSDCGNSLKSAAGSSSCVSTCPAGTYLANTDECLPCEAGKYKATASDAACSTVCQSGSYSHAGAIACTICPTATYSGVSAVTGISCCTKCAAGKKGISGSGFTTEGNACENCPAGKFSSVEASLQCTNCPVGQYSVAGSPQCTICFAGKYASSVGLSTCTNCPIGKYSGAWATACLDCPTGYTTTGAGSATCDVCL